MNKSVVGLMSTHLKKRGICSSPLLARIFLHSLCFSSTSSFFLSVFSIFPSSRSLTTPTQSKRKTDDLKIKKISWTCYILNIKQNPFILAQTSVYLSLSIRKVSPLVRAQACICRGQQGLKVRGQLIHLYRKAREAKVKHVVLGLWICKEAQKF